MRKTAIIGILLVALALLLSGCEQLFTFNLFDGLEEVNTENTVAQATSADKSASENLTEIESLVESDDFIDSLADDTESRDALIDYLDGVVNDPDAEPEDVQTALVLKGDIYTRTTGGDDLVNNITNLLSGDVDFENTEPEDLIASILPDTFYEEDGVTLKTGEEAEAAFAYLLMGFYYANDAYDSFGDTLVPDDETSLEADINLGDVAQNALISNIVAHAVEDLATNNGMTEEVAAARLAAVILGGSTEELAFSTDYDPFGGMGEGSGTYKLLMMSGLESLFAGE